MSRGCRACGGDRIGNRCRFARKILQKGPQFGLETSPLTPLQLLIGRQGRAESYRVTVSHRLEAAARRTRRAAQDRQLGAPHRAHQTGSRAVACAPKTQAPSRTPLRDRSRHPHWRPRRRCRRSCHRRLRPRPLASCGWQQGIDRTVQPLARRAPCRVPAVGRGVGGARELRYVPPAAKQWKMPASSVSSRMTGA